MGKRLNPYGMTLREWRKTAHFRRPFPHDSKYMMIESVAVKEWRAGVDPTDWAHAMQTATETPEGCRLWNRGEALQEEEVTE